MTLFTKEPCESCDYIKRNFDLGRLGVQVKVLMPDDPEALADLAWLGLVEEAGRSLPILVADDGSPVLGPDAVRDYLIRCSFALNTRRA
jgi:hypothetical protein